MTSFDKSKLPSRHVTEGPERAPHRSYLYAMGLTTEQIHQPLVGVATAWNEAAPCNISLMRQAQAVKKGVASNHGTPREFCTITVTDGIAPAELAGQDGAAIDEDRRHVEADLRHHHAGQRLVAAGHRHQRVIGMAAHGQLDRIRDHVTAGQ